MFDLRKQLISGTLADLTPEDQAVLQQELTEAVKTALEAGVDRLVVKVDPTSQYNTLLLALLPNEEYTLGENESFVQVPQGSQE